MDLGSDIPADEAFTNDAMTATTLPARHPLAEWLPIGMGLAALYVPTFTDLGRTIWNTEAQAHGPIVLAIIAWILWRTRHDWLNATTPPRPVPGWASLIVGLLVYIVGRSQDIIIFEVGALIPILLGTLLIQRGWGAVGAAWFALLFVVFLVPIPGFIIDTLTGPLKQNVSVIAENLLYAAGYPIARNGVVLTIGQYQLMVADACSGLHSMFSLSALGLLYLYLMQHKQWWRNGILLASILPTAFAANIIRVMILVLVTYHFGDEAGQGFIHGSAGMILFIVALLILFAIDSAYGSLARLLGAKRSD
jgi:exosortase B